MQFPNWHRGQRAEFAVLGAVGAPHDENPNNPSELGREGAWMRAVFVPPACAPPEGPVNDYGFTFKNQSKSWVDSPALHSCSVTCVSHTPGVTEMPSEAQLQPHGPSGLSIPHRDTKVIFFGGMTHVLAMGRESTIPSTKIPCKLSKQKSWLQL